MELTPVKRNTPIRYDRNIKKRKDDLRDRNENRFCTVYACVVCTEVEFLNSEELSPIKSSQLPAQFPAAPAGEELTLLDSSAPWMVQKSRLWEIGNSYFAWGRKKTYCTHLMAIIEQLFCFSTTFLVNFVKRKQRSKEAPLIFYDAGSGKYVLVERPDRESNKIFVKNHKSKIGIETTFSK